jgi:bacteriorhodopsin
MEQTTQPQEAPETQPPRGAETAPTQPTTTQTPLLVKIIAWLMIIGGALSLLGVLPALLIFPALGILQLIIAVGNIIVAVGILRLRRWAFYVFVALALLSIIVYGYNYITPIRQGSDLFVVLVEVALLIYFWSVRKLFK